MVHNVGMTPENEFQTIRITPASATRRKRFARKRAAQLAAIEADGWEVVDIEPERLLRPGDKVTVRRPAKPAPPMDRKREPEALSGTAMLVIAGVIAALVLAVVLDAVL